MPTATPVRPYVARKYKKKTEESEQVKACRWLNKTYPHVIFFSDAIGIKMSDTQRIAMMKMRSDGGQPDISIDFPVTRVLASGKTVTYHGLRIEFKPTGSVIYKKDGKTLRKQPYTRKYRRNGKIWIKKGDHLAEQAAMLEKYNSMGYLGRFTIGLEAFIKLVTWYMGDEQQTLF